MKKIIGLFAAFCLFFSACASSQVDQSTQSNNSSSSQLQEFDYTQLNLKDLLARIKQFKAKLERMDLSKGLDAASLNELNEINKQYKAFKALKFKKDTGEFAIQPRSRMIFRLNTYCLDPHRAAPGSKEKYTLQRDSPDIALYSAIALYTNAKVKTERTFKQSLIWNLKNEVLFENLPTQQQAFLLTMDPSALLKLNNSLTQEAKNQLTKFLNKQIPFYKQTSDIVGIVKGTAYTYQDYAQQVESMAAKLSPSEYDKPVAASGYAVYTLVNPSGYSSAIVIFINYTDEIQFVSITSYFKPSRKVQPLGFDLPEIYLYIEIYGSDIDKAFDDLIKFIKLKTGKTYI